MLNYKPNSLFDAPKGVSIETMAASFLYWRNMDSLAKLVGFVFNGVVVRYENDDDVASMVDRYFAKSGNKKSGWQPSPNRAT